MYRLPLFSVSRRTIQFFLICVSLSAAVALASDQTRIILKEKAIVDQDVIRLADIAGISGTSDAGSSPLGSAVVANSPLPGKTRFVSQDYIRIRLRQAGYQTGSMYFQGPQDIQIIRKAATVSRDAILRDVEAAIRRQMPWRLEDVAISNIRFDDKIQLPTGTLTHRIVPNRNENYLGKTLLALHLYVDGELFKKTWVHADISVMADVVKTVRPLGRNQRIGREDLTIVRADLSDLPSDTVRRIDEVLGNRTTQMIYPDTVLKTGMFTLPPLVRRGDIVKIVANAGPLTITATGKVRQKGCKGEMVDVINTDSNRIITARVIGPGAVEVDF